MRKFTWLSLLFFTLFLTGCGGSPDRLWLNAPDWSRAQFIGDTATGDAPIFALSPEGNVYFVLVANVNGRYHPQVIALDPQGAFLWKRDFDAIAMARPDQPRAYWTPQGIHMFWISAEQLYHAVLDSKSGDMITSASRISGDLRVAAYAVAVNAQGGLEVWFSGPRIAPGLYFFPNGDLSAAPVQVDELGISPQLAFDPEGNLHVLWAQHPMGETAINILYLRKTQGDMHPFSATSVAQPKAGLSSLFIGPSLGMDADHIYAFWSIEVRTGLGAGTVEARYTTFPPQQPQNASPSEQLFAPFDYHLNYQPWPIESIHAGQRDPLTPPLRGSLTQFSALRSSLPETATIQRQLVKYTMRNKEYQTSILFFENGAPTSYQLLSFTAGDTRSPYLTLDRSNYLYASWLERGVEGFRIFFASTAPQIRSHYNQLSMEDYGAFLGQTLFGMLTGAILLPFAMMWMIVPIILLLVTFPLRRGGNDLQSPGNLISLGLALAGYWIVKVSMLAGLAEFIPFSPWIPVIPGWLGPILQIGVPLTILVLGLIIAWLTTYRRENYSLVLFMLVYLAVDATLTTAIYGPIFLGTN